MNFLIIVNLILFLNFFSYFYENFNEYKIEKLTFFETLDYSYSILLLFCRYKLIKTYFKKCSNIYKKHRFINFSNYTFISFNNYDLISLFFFAVISLLIIIFIIILQYKFNFLNFDVLSFFLRHYFDYKKEEQNKKEEAEKKGYKKKDKKYNIYLFEFNYFTSHKIVIYYCYIKLNIKRILNFLIKIIFIKKKKIWLIMTLIIVIYIFFFFYNFLYNMYKEKYFFYFYMLLFHLIFFIFFLNKLFFYFSIFNYLF